LSEANDIKRTPDRLAEEMGLPADHMQAAIAGRLKPEEYHALFQAVTRQYPIAFGRLWMEPADNECGVLHMTAGESGASSGCSHARIDPGSAPPIMNTGTRPAPVRLRSGLSGYGNCAWSTMATR